MTILRSINQGKNIRTFSRRRVCPDCMSSNNECLHEKLSGEGGHQEAHSNCEGAAGFHGWEGRHCAYDNCFPDASPAAALWQSENHCWKNVTWHLRQCLSKGHVGKPSGKRFYGPMGLKFNFLAIMRKRPTLKRGVAASCCGDCSLQQSPGRLVTYKARAAQKKMEK